MKKLTNILLFAALLAAVSCGGNSNNKKAAANNEPAKEAAKPAAKAYKDMTPNEQFEAVIQRDYGFKFADVKLDAPYDAAKTEFSGMPEPGHMARVTYKKAEGAYTPEEVEAYIRKLYDFTKSKSQDGKNVLGFGFSNDDPAHALDEADLNKILTATEPKWCYRMKDQFWVCKIYAPKGNYIEATFIDGITKSVEEAVKEADKQLNK
ncbi:MAG: hypothetical protein J6S99_04970 [Bacteroidales bacterium]|nr:hypothetical protein [Bacteroidales bacterium]